MSQTINENKLIITKGKKLSFCYDNSVLHYSLSERGLINEMYEL